MAWAQTVAQITHQTKQNYTSETLTIFLYWLASVVWDVVWDHLLGNFTWDLSFGNSRL